MQNTLNFPPLVSSELDSPPNFNVVIAYEDFETGKHAKKTYDYLVEHLGDECRFENQMWKFDVLAVSRLREMAAKDAAAADIIIVSAHASNDLPQEVKAWFESWLMEEHRSIAIVGLFDSPERDENPARAYLEKIAQRGGVEFFSQPGNWPGDPRTGTADWQRLDLTMSALGGAIQQRNDSSHWGINE